MPFTLLDAPCTAVPDPRFDEFLIPLAARRPVACLWEADQCLVVPRTYQRHAGFERACQAFAKDGWPVHIRQSGGGIVPQGPGIVNLSLAYSLEGRPLDHSDDAYRRVCAVMQAALSQLGVDAHPASVEGSFCDGRYNLAVGTGSALRKVAGTAQVWRRTGDGTTRQTVLVHALLLAEVDGVRLTERANAFEVAIDNDRRYLPERIASLHELSPAGVLEPSDGFVAALKTRLRAVLSTADTPAFTPIPVFRSNPGQ